MKKIIGFILIGFVFALLGGCLVYPYYDGTYVAPAAPTAPLVSETAAAGWVFLPGYGWIFWSNDSWVYVNNGWVFWPTFNYNVYNFYRTYPYYRYHRYYGGGEFVWKYRNEGKGFMSPHHDFHPFH